MTNIETERQAHRRRCVNTREGVPDDRDVRYCKHGRLQIASRVWSRQPSMWRDMALLLEPIAYFRAWHALRSSQRRLADPSR